MAVQYPRETNSDVQINEPYKALARKILGSITYDDYDLIKDMSKQNFLALLGLARLQIQQNQDHCTLTTLDFQNLSELTGCAPTYEGVISMLRRLKAAGVVQYKNYTPLHNVPERPKRKDTRPNAKYRKKEK